MRKVLIALMAFIYIGSLNAGIQNSAHDLTYSGNTYYTTQTTELCIFCHYPHKTGSQTYLWNHTASSATYSFYTSSTMNATTPTSVSGSSAYCLSCHDGTVALGNLIMGGNFQMVGNDSLQPTSSAYVGTNLTDDHPISIQYEDGLFGSTNEDPDLRDRTSANAVTYGSYTLYLENEKVECGTCHDPHDTTNDPFLQAPTTNSAICFICHNK